MRTADTPAKGQLPVEEVIAGFLSRVQRRFEEQIASDLPPVDRLCRHVERYRGKMLRPTLVGLCGLAAAPAGGGLGEEHATLAAVCEMVHMATLVHDDVLDDAQVRRRGRTVNHLHGNEAAVILGDYLIASAYHLCSQLGSDATALLVGRTSVTMCAGELLQLDHRDDYSIDEATYYEILERKTGALIGLACRLGAMASGAAPGVCDGMEAFGRRVGVAFQIQDDLLDLTGKEAVVGKSVGRDLAKGKLTLPTILHLAGADAEGRGRALELLDRACGGVAEQSRGAAGLLAALLAESGAVADSRAAARRLAAEAGAVLAATVPDSPARRRLLEAANAAVLRMF